MTKRALSSFCAAVLIAAYVRPAAAQALLQRCEKPIADATAVVDQVVACIEGLAKEKSVLARTNQPTEGAERMIPKLTPMPADVKSATAVEPLRSRLLAYYTYTAAVAGDSSRCEPLSLLNLQESCIDNVRQLGFFPALMGTAEQFSAVCRGNAPDAIAKSAEMRPEDVKTARQYEGTRRAQCCTLAWDTFKDPNACAKMVPNCIPSLSLCRAHYASFKGDPSLCASIQTDGKSGCRDAEDCRSKREQCQGQAAYSTAFKAKDISRCGTSNVCRVMMGEGKQVLAEMEPGLKAPAAQWFLKGEWTAKKRVNTNTVPNTVQKIAVTIPGFTCEYPVGTEANRKVPAAAINSAHSCLADIELALSKIDIETAKGIDAREEKLARLNLRVGTAFDSAVVKAPVGAAPAKRPK